MSTKYAWYNVSIDADPDVPAYLALYCKPCEFYICVTSGKSVKDKADKVVRNLSIETLLDAFEDAGGDRRSETSENIAVFKFWLKQKGEHWIGQESKKFETIANDCSCLRKMYKILAITTAPSCEACRCNELGQSAHMIEGGCLYQNE
jgi:hypothetical protein